MASGVGYVIEDLPHGRRGADRLALALYRELVDRSEVNRRYVLRKLRPAGRDVGNLIRGPMVDALRLCEVDIGRFPSYRAYEAWRLEQERPGDWHSGSSIARAFGSWSAMLAELDIEPVAHPRSPRLRSFGAPFTRAELLEAIARMRARGS